MSAGAGSPLPAPTAVARVAAPPPSLDQVRALAYTALLDLARRNDHEHALETLLRALAALTGAECSLRPLPPDRSPPPPPFYASPPVQHRSAAWGTPPAAWPCTHAGAVVGELCLPLPAGLSHDDWGDRLGPARDAAAALLAALFERGGRVLPGSLALMRKAMHESGTFVWEWDMASDVLGDIDEGERMLGYPLNTLGTTQADWDKVIHPEDRHLVDRAFEAHLRGEQPLYRVVYRARAHDGQWRWIEERGRVVERDRDGKPLRMFGTQTDATLLRELEQAQRDRLAAQAANSAKTLFLSRISHELRTPLNAVLGFAQLLGTDPALARLPAQRQQLQLIREAGEHLLAMIGDLLDLSLAEANRLTVQLQPVALAPLLEACAAWCRSQAESARIGLRVVDPDAGAALDEPRALVRADPVRLRQIITNLLSNAIKYNDPGGRVTLSARPDGDAWWIEVEDTGHGITPTDRARLFQPFNRLGREATGIAGAGLGLALSQSLAQLMGGRITVDSSPGIGSTFRISLPAA